MCSSLAYAGSELLKGLFQLLSFLIRKASKASVSIHTTHLVVKPGNRMVREKMLCKISPGYKVIDIIQHWNY